MLSSCITGFCCFPNCPQKQLHLGVEHASSTHTQQTDYHLTDPQLLLYKRTWMIVLA